MLVLIYSTLLRASAQGQIPTLIMATNLHIVGQPPGVRAVALLSVTISE